MEDIYSSLIGAAPTDAQRQAEIVAQLRRQRKLGELGQLSGDKILAPFGQGQIKSADDFSTQLQLTRQKDADNAQTKSYQDSQIKHMGDVLRETMRGNNLDYAAQMAAIQGREAVAAMKQSGGGKAISPPERKRLEGIVSGISEFQDSIGSWKPEYAGSGLPGTGSLMNAIAAKAPALAPKAAEEKQLWWANWDRVYNIPERYEKFGATLTPAEKQSWADANISPNMTDFQIRTNIGKINELNRRLAARAQQNLINAGFDPEEVAGYFSDVEGLEAPKAGPKRSAGPTESASSSKTTQQYSDEDIMKQLQQLRQMVGEE
jgi:hypothetical protein